MIPFLDLKAQYHSIKPEIDAALQRVLESTQFVLGNEVSAFEEEFAQYVQCKYAVALNSGTSALHLALLATGIGEGDEVITVSFTFVATVAAILYAKATPVFVDVDPQTFCMDTTQIEAAITPKTKAIMPVHLYGQMANMDAILEIARRHNLIVIEDAAQAHGAEDKGRRAGSLGDVSGFSFYPGKNLGAYGEGGLLATNNPEIAKMARMLRDWGQSKRYHHDFLGYNYRMDGFQGAILRVKLRYLEEWTEARRAHAAEYNRLLSGSGIPTPIERPDARHVYHIYAVRVAERAALQEKLTAAGVSTGIHYPIPVHLQQGYATPTYKAGDLPHSEGVAGEVLSLPMFAELTSEQVEQVTSALIESVGALKTT